MKGKTLNLEHACQKLKIDLNCLLYFFRERFYNIEHEHIKVSQKDFAKLERYKRNNIISEFFLTKGFQVLIKDGV